MNKEKLLEQIARTGLTSNQAKVYLSLLEFGSATVLELSKVSDMKRSTLYGVLDSLVPLGLVTMNFQSHTTKFTAEPPKALERLLDYKKQELAPYLTELEQLFHISNNRVDTKVYKGKMSVRKAYEFVLTHLLPTDSYLVFGDAQAWHDADPEFSEKWPEQRKKVMTKGRSILFDSQYAREWKAQEHHLETKVLLLNLPDTPRGTGNSFNLPASPIPVLKIITTRFVLIHKISGENIAYIIENQDISSFYKVMFEIIWGMISE